VKIFEQPPVLIVGAGPVGQLAALLLSYHGIPSLLVDKRLALLTAPKAHAVNPRTLEICDSIGVSAERLRLLGADANDAGDVRFVGTLSGPEFGSLPYERQDAGALRYTPYPLSNIPQPRFEEALSNVIAGDANIQFSRGVECVQLVNEGERVVAELRNVQTGARDTKSFAYAIATDGAGSSTRDALGIRMQGPEALQDFLMLHFTVDLRPFTQGRPGVLYFLFAPDVRGTLIAYDQAHTWVLMYPWDPKSEKLDDYDDERCRSALAQAVGQPVPGAIVENVSPWSMSAQIAQEYRSQRIFIAGDAAHRFPPAGGLGLNTGAGDVQNLTWKLAAVLQARAGSGLLDTYETEREPVARTNSEQSLKNAFRLFDLFTALHGTEPDSIAEHYACVVADPAACSALAEAVAAQKPHFDSFNLQLGYRYTRGAIYRPAPAPALTDVSDYQPSWDAGAHFPHRWVTVNGTRQALQQLLPANRFTLMYGPHAPRMNCDNYLHEIRWGADFLDDSDWAEQTGLPHAGAFLIRPDGHIAARFEQLADEALANVMDFVLHREK
jgi:2-polyprenyl-6-methoxyphenol hydroxylase-like FAD-dependent oxidoreductase